MFNVQLELLYVLLPVRSRQRTDERSNSNPSNQNGQADARSQNGETRLPWHKRLWFQLAYQETPGRRALFRLRFCVGFFLGLCIMFLVGGGFLLSFSLQQVQIRVTYSGASPLDQFNNEQRSLLMQGQRVDRVSMPPDQRPWKLYTSHVQPSTQSPRLLRITAFEPHSVAADRPSGAPNEAIHLEFISVRMNSHWDAGVDGQVQPVVSNIDILVEHDMEQPIYIYYILHEFYQNHKRYVKSVDWQQIHGKNKSAGKLVDCAGQKRYVTNSENRTLERDGLVSPCGLISWSFFNDTFTDFKAVRQDQTELMETIVVDSDELAWSTDRDSLFGNVEPLNHNTLPAFRGGKEMLLNVSQDEHFMVWMRPAAHSDVRKYYGVIRTDLKKGDRLQFSVTHQYNTYDFNGEKELLFTTSGPFGNRNLTFGIVWLAMGGLTGCITLAYVVLGWHQIWSIERRVADLQRRWLRGSAQYHLGDTYPYPDGLPPGKQY